MPCISVKAVTTNCFIDHMKYPDDRDVLFPLLVFLLSNSISFESRVDICRSFDSIYP